ncbi:MAG TPA: STAS domain-containing protein [Spirochaetota bacterium]|nr:STAS domain-containing protein [Spirochaetota bacterium]HOM37855.1 STAS domain-containing protein [Spirochaetota bacterium]HPQ48659.1 STAS domain-containing protein [Spirochaetota bacterium]
MDYEIKKDDNTIILKFKEAELIETFSDEKYSDLLIQIAEENKNIILDFENVEVVDSLFIGALIIVDKKLASNGKTLKLINLNKFLSELFDKLRLGTNLEM